MKRAYMVVITLAAIVMTSFVYADGDVNKSGSTVFTHSIPQKLATVSPVGNTTLLPGLIREALENNPEIRAAHQERTAAQQRIAPAEALDDPMLEAGVINAPLASSPFNREDMTMKMIGLSQRLPFPGKRGLRKEVASKDAQAIEYGYQETVNRVIHDLKTAYFDLGLTLEMIQLVEKNRQTLEHFLRITEERYQVGQGSQADVLKAQTQVSRMLDRLLELSREQPVFEAELIRALGHNTKTGTLVPVLLHVQETPLILEALQQEAMAQRPQLLALQSLIARNEKSVDLARRAYYPDLDVRFSYGQRDSMLDGSRRDDMVSMTVAINLPVWRGNKIEPRILEAQALRDQIASLYQAQSNEVAARLRQQIAMAEQSLKSVKLYQTTILPQAQLTVESALTAYQVGRVDFLTLLDNQMTVFDFEANRITAMANYNKALAEIDWLVGKKHAH
ncbi:TolC family protein [Nitrosomonas sp.]|uniref:TolC family protein n=1 Tax=Nitrosomonas sp. TaxID=42353 RepID=UPI0025CF30F8|nr:TolC family protein [Nitrosomonas sp.]